MAVGESIGAACVGKVAWIDQKNISLNLLKLNPKMLGKNRCLATFLGGRRKLRKWLKRFKKLLKKLLKKR